MKTGGVAENKIKGPPRPGPLPRRGGEGGVRGQRSLQSFPPPWRLCRNRKNVFIPAKTGIQVFEIVILSNNLDARFPGHYELRRNLLRGGPGRGKDLGLEQNFHTRWTKMEVYEGMSRGDEKGSPGD